MHHPAGMPSWNPFSRGRSPRAARERLASARALAASTRDLRAAAAADDGAARPTPEQALVALQAPPGAGIQSTARPRRVAGDADAGWPSTGAASGALSTALADDAAARAAATPTTPPAQAALDERWIAAPTFLDEAFPEGSADGAKLAGAVAELRLDLGPAHVAALAAAGLGDRAAFAAALRAAAAAHDAARAGELKAAATTAISAATTQFSVATSAAADDGEATVHPHAYNGYLAVVAHNHTKPAMKKFVEENVDVVSLFPIVTTRSTGAVLENAFGLAVQHKTCSGPLGGDQEIGALPRGAAAADGCARRRHDQPGPGRRRLVLPRPALGAPARRRHQGAHARLRRPLHPDGQQPGERPRRRRLPRGRRGAPRRRHRLGRGDGRRHQPAPRGRARLGRRRALQGRSTEGHRRRVGVGAPRTPSVPPVRPNEPVACLTPPPN